MYVKWANDHFEFCKCYLMFSYWTCRTNNVSLKIPDIQERMSSARFGSTYTKIGTMQRRLAWPLRKDDAQIHEAFHNFFIIECGRENQA